MAVASEQWLVGTKARAIRTSLLATSHCLCALLSLLSGCQSPLPQSISTSSAAASGQFSDVSDAAGIRFVHRNGAFGKKWMPETVGSGCAFLDIDNDGWEDILLVNSGSFSGVQVFRRIRPFT
jgi:hypothetical protein